MQHPPELLLVDADDGSRAALAALLRGCGFAVAEARNGAEGLQVAHESDPAVVILDPWPFVSAAVRMVERLRESRPGTQVLVLTSRTEGGRNARARFATARCLERPCPEAEILFEVARLLDASTRRRSEARPLPRLEA